MWSVILGICSINWETWFWWSVPEKAQSIATITILQVRKSKTQDFNQNSLSYVEDLAFDLGENLWLNERHSVPLWVA